MHWPGWSPGASPRWACTHTGALAVNLPPCRSAPRRWRNHLQNGECDRLQAGFQDARRCNRCAGTQRCPSNAWRANAAACHSITHAASRRDSHQTREAAGSRHGPSFHLALPAPALFSNVIPPFDQGQANEGAALARRVGHRPLVVGLGPIISPAPQPNQDAATSRLVTAFPSFSSLFLQPHHLNTVRYRRATRCHKSVSRR